MKVLAVCIGQSEPSEAKSGITGYFKKPVAQPVAVTRMGVSGDFIADLDNHGGVEQAVYIFGDFDRKEWSVRLDRPCPPGFFGENLLIGDLRSADLCLGDILVIGDVQIQITSPRIPCATYASVIKMKSALKDFYDAEMPGAYARVLAEGQLDAGADVQLIPWQGERISVIENMAAYRRNFPDPTFLERALTVPAHQELHVEAKKRLALL